MKALLLLWLGLASAGAASVPLVWSPVAGAVEYVVFSGPASGEFDRVRFTTNSTFTVTNLTLGQLYRFGVIALNSGNSSEMASVIATPRAAILLLEWGQSPTGPWTVQASNMVEAPPGFYRGRMEIR